MKADIYDVIVVGGGNAALCAALSAREQVARVLLLERAPPENRGGNSVFTAGSFRMVHDGLPSIQTIITDLSDDEIARTDFGKYTAADYFDDLGRVTQYHIRPDLAETLVQESAPTVKWIKEVTGLRFVPMYGRYAFNHEGRFKFFGGVVVSAVGGGPGLVEGEYKACERLGIEVRYRTQGIALLRGDHGIEGVRVNEHGVAKEVRSRAVVLACGGFEANAEWRTRYLGPGWDMAKVRGTRFNTGDGIRMALEVGAQPYGQWSGCHAVSWERNAPDFGDFDANRNSYRHSYPFSIMVNGEGMRFVDEGADFRNYTYAKYGRIVLQQPGSYAWQVFDAQVAHLIRDEYRLRGATKAEGNTLEELCARMQDVEPGQFLRTVKEFNAAVAREVPFDPNVKDSRRTHGLAVDKTNWANPIEKPPFVAYAVGCGVTFTFGGLKIDTAGRVLDIADVPLPGLHAAGELVGGIFYFNYPGSSGLMAGSVFGRIAGYEAGTYARNHGGGQP